ncbi:hypothetical protein AX15_003508 [Amanita polypyramis BW_CC]|nr:hypothetical protein AX15_003508 [Amanita polypyramis BW_CC]
MVASKTSFIAAAVALGAASTTYAIPTPYHDEVSLSRREVDNGLSARDFNDELEELYAREFYDELDTRDFEEAAELEARDFDDDELYARELYEDDLEARDFEEDLMARAVTHTSESSTKSHTERAMHIKYGDHEYNCVSGHHKGLKSSKATAHQSEPTGEHKKLFSTSHASTKAHKKAHHKHITFDGHRFSCDIVEGNDGTTQSGTTGKHSKSSSESTPQPSSTSLAARDYDGADYLYERDLVTKAVEPVATPQTLGGSTAIPKAHRQGPKAHNFAADGALRATDGDGTTSTGHKSAHSTGKHILPGQHRPGNGHRHGLQQQPQPHHKHHQHQHQHEHHQHQHQHGQKHVGGTSHDQLSTKPRVTEFSKDTSGVQTSLSGSRFSAGTKSSSQTPSSAGSLSARSLWERLVGGGNPSTRSGGDTGSGANPSLFRTPITPVREEQGKPHGIAHRKHSQDGTHRNDGQLAGKHHTGPHHTGPHHTGEHHTGEHHTGPYRTGEHHNGPHHNGPHHRGPHHIGKISAVDHTNHLGKEGKFGIGEQLSTISATGGISLGGQREQGKQFRQNLARSLGLDEEFLEKRFDEFEY